MVTGTIIVTADLNYRRVGVQLGGWAAPDGSETVFRVHPDTSEWTVRGLDHTSGGAGFAWDYEAPLGLPVTYYAFDGSAKVVSAPVTLASAAFMLRVPGLPAMDVTLDLTAKPVRTIPRASTTMRPLGRDTAVVLQSSRQKGDFAVVVETHSDQEGDALDLALRQGTLLMLLPGTRRPWQYVAVTDALETPFISTTVSVAAGDPGSWATWSLPCTVVAVPVGGVFGDPTASYQVVRDTYATYTTVRAAKATYLELLKGV